MLSTNHASKSIMLLQHHHVILSAATCHDIALMASRATSMHKVEHSCASAKRGKGCTTSYVIAIMGCMPHTSWNPCVSATMLVHVPWPCPRSCLDAPLVWPKPSFGVFLESLIEESMRKNKTDVFFLIHVLYLINKKSIFFKFSFFFKWEKYFFLTVK